MPVPLVEEGGVVCGCVLPDGAGWLEEDAGGVCACTALCVNAKRDRSVKVTITRTTKI
jgi:hypothetical protein